MVVYKCSRCKKEFLQKCKYTEHMNRKFPCAIKKKLDNNDNDINPDESYCDICNKSFSRPDALKRHLETSKHKKKSSTAAPINNNKIYKNKGTINQIIGDKNKITNNNFYLISPFSQEEIDHLTTKEKLAIFFSNDDPIVLIIILTNLNPLTPQYHNVGYTNSHEGYGYIFNGKNWEIKPIQTIMNDLLYSKREDLLKIYREIKEYLTDDDHKDIEEKLDDLNCNVEPKLESDIKLRRKLIMNLKAKFVNNKHLVQAAIKNSNKEIIDCEEPYNNHDFNIKLKNGISVDQLDIILKDKNQLLLKKDVAYYILQKIDNIDNSERQELVQNIDQTRDLKQINIIIQLITESFCSGDEINNDIIERKISEKMEINKFIM